MERSVVLKILKGIAPGGETLFSYEVIIGTETFTTHDIAHAQKMASEHARPGTYKVEGQGGPKKRGRKPGAKSAAPKKPAAKKPAAKKSPAKKAAKKKE